MQMQKEAYATKLDEKLMDRLPLMNKVDGSHKFTEKEEKSLREYATYELYNIEEPGHPISFHYQGYPFRLLHGGRYKLPKFIANHIEEVGYPVWDWVPDGSGKMEKKIKSFTRRFQARQVG